jgi:hypothetical protein
MGYAVKSFVEERPSLEADLARLEQACNKDRGSPAFAAYPVMMRAVVAKDRAAAQTAFEAILVGHKKQSKRGVFKGRMDEYLAYWPLGMANLARRRGVAIESNDEIVPKDLLTPVTG